MKNIKIDLSCKTAKDMETALSKIQREIKAGRFANVDKAENGEWAYSLEADGKFEPGKRRDKVKPNPYKPTFPVIEDSMGL